MLLNIFFQKEEAVGASTKMSQDFILVCGEEGGEPCEVVSTLIHYHLKFTLDFASISKTLLPPGASGARRVCGAGQHPGSVPGNHWHQISQPSNSGLLAADLVVIWLLINHTRMFFIKRLENTSQNIIS